MARLPNPGSDDGVWGDVLNAFLAVEHNADGTLKNVARLSGGAIPANQLPAATNTTQGAIVLTNDLSGTASAPTVPGLVQKVDLSAYTNTGDILVAADTNQPTALTVGSDGQILTADSAEATGVKWVSPSVNSGNELAWNGVDYVPTGLKADTSKPRTFKGPVDPSGVPGVVMNSNDWFDSWIGGV